MDLEKISRFLGHSSLESTQVYTHIVEAEKEPSTELRAGGVELHLKPQTFSEIKHFSNGQLHEDER
jgi:hypothetical protein